ncbi:probable S-adenosylmethionine-dependent methyltransferase At5g37970 isoform X1 [Actinia tenebrosa]|uniref:Probable S-adenosylmethionine-dependent methyltransferase At5g37970 isoform X1 n=1 Tax=Actinia tenebrosa TaxID=6105 RepID=A0A6P8JAE6_ACTTE|nr:probable S-adenosylmethionine-dependent methyltransferase At5g37970 isoform X1 [Actinia tenebrosa]
MEEKNAFVPHSHLPYGKVGSGFYSTRSIANRQVVKTATPLVLRELDAMALEKQSVVTLVDYGTADGGISMDLIYACVKAIREKYGAKLPINVIYEDQPVNDFTSVFLRTQGLIPGPRSYLLDFPNVFVMASGTNFYDQCFPNDSVTLGFSSNCAHWLRDKPCDMTGTTCHLFITVPEEKEKFGAQAEKDWELYLTKRAAELSPGGSMALAELAVDENDQFTGHTKDAKYCSETVLSTIWKSLSDEGIITKDEVTKTNIISYFRKVDEFKKPFKCPDSPVVKAGLELVSIETKIVPCAYKEKWIKEKGDAKEHAKKYVGSILAWSNSTFLSGLSDSRSAEEKSKIVDELYHRYEAEVAKCPEDYGVDYVNAYLVIRKRLLKGI